MYTITKYVLLGELLKKKCVDKGRVMKLLADVLPRRGITPNASIHEIETEIIEVLRDCNTFSRISTSRGCLYQNGGGTICLRDGCESFVNEIISFLEKDESLIGGFVRIVKDALS